MFAIMYVYWFAKESGQLYKEATSLVCRSQTNLMTFNELEEKLVILDETTKESLQAGRQLAKIRKGLNHV